MKRNCLSPVSLAVAAFLAASPLAAGAATMHGDASHAAPPVHAAKPAKGALVKFVLKTGMTDGKMVYLDDKGVANPTAVMLAGCQMLDHVGEVERANRIRKAIEGVLRERKTVTRDVGGTAGTDEYTDAVIKRLGA